MLIRPEALIYIWTCKPKTLLLNILVKEESILCQVLLKKPVTVQKT